MNERPPASSSSSRGDPILRAHRRAGAHRRRSRGVLGNGARILGVLLGVAALAAVFRPVFLAFLDEGSGLPAGVGGAVLRLAVVLVGLAGIDVYESIIRGPDRDVLALLPVDAWSAVRASLLRVIQNRWWLVPGSAALMLPVGVEATWLGWTASVLALWAVLAFAWPTAAVLHLLAVHASTSEALGPLLDLARGANPRAQAAFVYAPGLLLVSGALVIYAASSGAAFVVAGDPTGWALLAVGPAAGAVASLALPALARSAWFKASAVLSEIDAAYAGLVDSDGERLHVYLDWALRFLPSTLHRDALHDLRHGWRGRRLWLTGAWALGVAGGLAAWTSDPSGPLRGVAVAALSAALVASVVLVLENDEPAFLRWWLPRDAVRARLARALVVIAWAQPAVLPPALVTAFMAGLFPALAVVAAGQGLLLGVTVLALGAAPLGRASAFVYGPVATALVAGVVLVWGYALP